MDRVNPLKELPVIDPGAPLLELIAGDRGAILSAPHAEPHFRGDYWKGRDSGSGDLARLIASATGARALILGAPAEADPNWYPGGEFKETLRTLATERESFLIDLHVMRDDWGFDALVGTARRPSALGDHAVAALMSAGLWRVELREEGPFSGSGSPGTETVIRWALDTLEIPAIQLEIRFGLIGHARDERLIAALESIVGWRP